MFFIYLVDFVFLSIELTCRLDFVVANGVTEVRQRFLIA